MAVAAVWSAAALAATSTLTKADTALAGAALLRRSDLGRGWVIAAASPAHVAPLTCSQYSPSVSGAVLTGNAQSPTFRGSSGGPFISSFSYVYRTTAQAATVWRRVVTARLLTCVAAGFTGQSGHGVKFTVDGRHLLSLPPIAAQRRGYRVIGTVTGPDQQFGAYSDELVLRRGRMITAISVTNSFVAPSRTLELTVARKIAVRMPSQ